MFFTPIVFFSLQRSAESPLPLSNQFKLIGELQYFQGSQKQPPAVPERRNPSSVPPQLPKPIIQTRKLPAIPTSSAGRVCSSSDNQVPLKTLSDISVRYVNNSRCGSVDYSETNSSQLNPSSRRKENIYVMNSSDPSPSLRRYSEAYPIRRDSTSSNYDYPELVKIPPPRPELPRKLSEGKILSS
jgi:hypothetical protein